MKGSCPNCGIDETLILVRGVEEFNIRGEKIPVEVEYYRCKECGEEFDRPRPGYDPTATAYKEYRRRKGIVQPEETEIFGKGID